ncbi:DNA methyltransferase [Acinetobacter pittii]|uniref:DNA methyltransferase n=1 Tax=Acinetobacter pittii TaxID=48296 RepID=UPI00355BB141
MTTENNTLDLPEEKPQEGVFKFEPIKGYPMLNWKGKRPFTSTRYYPAQLKEQHGKAVKDWFNKIFWGDNLQVMSHLLREFRGKVELIYIDPPYDSKADYKKKISLRSLTASSDSSVFEEKQYTDIWTNDAYLQWVYDRLILAKELLSKNGSIYVHIDWRKSSHIKLIMDEIFGPENFRNGIVWHYGGRMMHGVSQFNRKYDMIMYYTKTSEFYFDLPKDQVDFDDYAKSRHEKIHIDEDGRRFLLAPDANMARTIKQYEEDIVSQGRAIDDCWDITPWDDPIFEVRYIRGNAKERQDYPTQKPEALIERIISASSKPGDIVLDFVMGSGTTQAVALKTGRRFIGADINLGAVQTTTKRLLNIIDELANTQPELGEEVTLYTNIEIYNVNHYDIFRNPVQAKDLLIKALDIQPISNSIYDGEKDGRMVKLMPVNHIATKADVADLIHGVDYKAFEKRKEEKPNQPVEKMTLICMGHEPDLASFVKHEIGYKLDVEVMDILRDRSDLQFKRDSEALFKVENGQLVVDKFYPMNLLQKLSQTKDTVSDWREMVESIMIDWNYDGAVFQPALTDIPAKNELVRGAYTIPEDAGTIRIKITDLLSESLERNLTAEELANG